MFIYVGKRFNASKVGTRVAGVKCDKCGCEYFYELTRVGTGAGEAPYMIGTGSAASHAEKASERDLQQRLASDAELVPCPSCNWISDELVQAYRRGRLGWLDMLAVALGFFGIVVSLIIAWFINTGPADGWVALPYFLYGGPILSVSFTAGLMLLAHGLRKLINPNRAFPRAPRLPRGTPPALFMDAETEELRPAKPDQMQVNGAAGWLDFQLSRHQLPLVCFVCLKPATTERAFEIPVDEALKLEVPRCPACAKKAGRKYWLVWLITAALGSLVAGGLLLLLDLDSLGYWMFFSLLFLLICAIAGVAGTLLSRPPLTSSVDPSRGIVRLRFGNADYGRLVAEHMQKNGPGAK